MSERYIVFYSCSGKDDEIDYIDVFPDEEIMHNDYKRFKKDFPSGLFLSVPFSLHDDYDFDLLYHYFDLYHDNH